MRARLAILIVGILLVPVAVSAQRARHARAGGLPRCEARLADTTTRLNACTGDLITCDADLGTCSDDLGMCEEDLTTCEESRVVFPGDGAGRGAPLRYEVCADGLTVADLNTRLLWERKVAASGGAATCLTDLHGVDSRCTWTQATGDWIDAVNAEGFAGFSDWRVPNLKELHSIVDSGRFDPAIDPAFGPTPSTVYWSATTVARPPGSNVWRVVFWQGQVRNGGRFSGAWHVRAVRNGPCSTP